MPDYKVGPFEVTLDSYDGGEWTEASCDCEYFYEGLQPPVRRECKHIQQARLYASLETKITILD